MDVNRRPLLGAAVQEVAAANRLWRLRMLCKDELFTAKFVADTVQLAPSLARFDTDVRCASNEAGSMLQNEPPYAPLHLRTLVVEAPWAGTASVLALARDAAAHQSLRVLVIINAPLETAAALAAVVDAAIGLRLVGLDLLGCGLNPGSVLPLARLLRCGHLRVLVVHNTSQPLLGGDGDTAAFCAALRSCPLTAICLEGVDLWLRVAAGHAVVSALAAHPTLVEAQLDGNAVFEGDEPAVGASLARLLQADTLARLSVQSCLLMDAGLRPLMAALRGCTRLHCLDLSDNSVTAAFARGELLPSVAANASLRELKAVDVPNDVPGHEEDGEAANSGLARAEALVAVRGAAAAA